VKIFSRKRHTSVEVDPEFRAAFDELPDVVDGSEDPFDDDEFAQAIREGRERDPEPYDDQKIA
jgi:hypothetical protein